MTSEIVSPPGKIAAPRIASPIEEILTPVFEIIASSNQIAASDAKPHYEPFEMETGGGVTSVYVRLSHRIQKGQDIGGHRRT